MVNKTISISGKMKKGVYKGTIHNVGKHPSVSRFQRNFQSGHNGQPVVSPHNTKFKELPF